MNMKGALLLGFGLAVGYFIGISVRRTEDDRIQRKVKHLDERISKQMGRLEAHRADLNPEPSMN